MRDYHERDAKVLKCVIDILWNAIGFIFSNKL